MEYYIDIATTCLMNLANATGAEFEDEVLAVEIIAATLKKTVTEVIKKDCKGIEN